MDGRRHAAAEVGWKARAVDDALAAQASGRGEVGEPGVGLSSGAWYGLEPLFDAVRERHPGLRLHVRQQSARPLLDEVRAGTLELTEAGGGQVALAELAGETVALDDPAEGPDYNAAVLGAFAAAGVTPRTRVGLTVRSAIHSSHRDLHLLAVAPRVTFPLDLLWQDERPAIAAVAAIAAEVTRREGWLAP